MPHRPASLHDMYYARAYPAYGHHLPHHSYPESNGRSTPESDYSFDSRSRTRWILSLGLLLPALAAIIGESVDQTPPLSASCLQESWRGP